MRFVVFYAIVVTVWLVALLMTRPVNQKLYAHLFAAAAAGAITISFLEFALR